MRHDENKESDEDDEANLREQQEMLRYLSGQRSADITASAQGQTSRKTSVEVDEEEMLREQEQMMAMLARAASIPRNMPPFYPRQQMMVDKDQTSTTDDLTGMGDTTKSDASSVVSEEVQSCSMRSGLTSDEGWGDNAIQIENLQEKDPFENGHNGVGEDARAQRAQEHQDTKRGQDAGNQREEACVLISTPCKPMQISLTSPVKLFSEQESSKASAPKGPNTQSPAASREGSQAKE